jgi:hypothetical protein
MSETVMEHPKDKTPLQLAVERIIERAKNSTPEQKIKSLQRSGILDENGELKEPYIGIDKLIHRAS